MSDGLSESERQQLAAVTGAMIPADAERRMPAANDPLILADIEKSIGRDLRLVHEALKSYHAGQDINAWYKSGGSAAAALGRLVTAAYYRDDRVLVAIGHEARSPFPKGYEIDQGDWSLLDKVRARPPFWRDDREELDLDRA
jgi:hypothetical protein